MEPADYRAPVHRSLVSPLLLMGIPREICLSLWTVGAAMAFGMQEIWVLPFFIIAHAGFALLTQADPHFAAVYRCALKTPKALNP